MSHSTKSARLRTVTVAGGLAILGATGAGLAGTANAASSSGSASTVLAKIKYCESGGNYQAVNSSSGASGAYQFLDSTWRGLSAASGYSTAASAPASVQDAAALELYSQQGTSPWAASSSCWSSMTSVPSSASGTSAATTSSSSTTSAAGSTASTSTASTAGSKIVTTPAKGPKAPASARTAPKPHGKDVRQPAGSVKGHGAHDARRGKHHAKPAAPVHPGKPANALPKPPQQHGPQAQGAAPKVPAKAA